MNFEIIPNHLRVNKPYIYTYIYLLIALVKGVLKGKKLNLLIKIHVYSFEDIIITKTIINNLLECKDHVFGIFVTLAIVSDERKVLRCCLNNLNTYSVFEIHSQPTPVPRPVVLQYSTS